MKSDKSNQSAKYFGDSNVVIGVNFSKNGTRKEKLKFAMPEFDFHIALSVDIDLENRKI